MDGANPQLELLPTYAFHTCPPTPNPIKPNACATSFSAGRSETMEESIVQEARLWETLVVLCAQAQFWLPWGCKSGSWATKQQPIVLDKAQVLQYLVCHFDALGLDVLALNTSERKGLITYN